MTVEGAALDLRPQKQYKEPKLIPDDLTCAKEEPCVPLENRSAVGAAMVVKLARDTIVHPALALTDPQEYIKFLADRAEEFAGFLQTLSALNNAGDAISGSSSVGARRRGFFSGCFAAAAHHLGAAGVTKVRAGIADALSAFQIVERFPSRGLVLADDNEDLETLSDYNFALDWQNALLVCLYESRATKVDPRIVERLVAFPSTVGEWILESAKTAAARRGVSVDLEIGALQPVWDQPTPDLIAYLDSRAPDLVTADLRAASARYESFNALAARVANGESVASPGLVQQARELTASDDSVDIDHWAKKLADDLSHYRD